MNVFELIFASAALYGLVLLSEILAFHLGAPRWAVLPIFIGFAVEARSRLSKVIHRRLAEQLQSQDEVSKL